MIRFEAPILSLASQTIVKLPQSESQKLPSRGQVAVTGTIEGYDLRTVLEPDGYWGHWMRIGPELRGRIGRSVGDTVTVELGVTKAWPEPVIPRDMQLALDSAPEAVKEKWQDITPMARWEWIRWVNSTANDETRTIRIEKTISKLAGKHRRPCCFNLAACTDPELSRSGRLMQLPVAT